MIIKISNQYSFLYKTPENTEVSSITPSSPSNPLAAPSNTPQELESRPSGRSKSTDYGCTSRALHVNPDDTEDPQLLNGIVNPTLAKQKFFKTNSAPNMVVDQSNKGLDLNCTNHFDCEGLPGFLIFLFVYA